MTVVGGLDFGDGPVAPAPTRRPWLMHGRVMGALAVVILLVVAVAVVGLQTVGSNGGAASPESAVEKLLEAAEAADLLGVLESLLPSERVVLIDPIVDASAELRRLGVLSDNLNLSRLDGFAISFEAVTLRSEVVGDGVVAVFFTGGLVRTRTDPARLPLGPEARRMSGSPGSPEETVEELADSDEAVVVVEDGGRWYVSLAYSLAEAIRRDVGIGPPAFGHGVVARGAASPEAAVEALAQALAQLDLRRVVELAPPDEAMALLDYAPLFLLAAPNLDHGTVVEIRALELSTRRNGDRARVKIERLEIEVRSGGSASTVRYSDGCIEATGALSAFLSSRVCRGAGDGGFIPADGFALSTVERNGQWYVSPTRTVTDMLIENLRSLERADVANPEKLSTGLAFYLLYFLEGVPASSGRDEANCTIDSPGNSLCIPPMAPTVSTVPVPTETTRG